MHIIGVAGALILGGILLWLGGEGLVRGSVSLAYRRGVPPLWIGMTVVALGTSAPELCVSLIATWQGNPDIAVGNVLGSNLANLGLVLGIAALLRPLLVHTSSLRLEIPLMLGATGITWLLAGNRLVSRGDGVLLVVLLIGFLLFYKFRASTSPPPELPASTKKPESLLNRHAWLEVALILAGIGALVFGSDLFIRGATTTARLLGVSEFFIGLSVVAIGTSLPELAAVLVAVSRNKTDLAVGTLVGSNIFNLLMILGVVSLVKPISIPAEALRFDFPAVMLLSALVFPLAWWRKRLGRREGLLLLLCYAGYIGMIAWRG